MKTKKTILAALSVGLVMMAGCQSGQDSAAEDAVAEDSAALKVGVTPTLDCLPLYVAEASGLFYQPDAPDVRLRRYSAHMDCDTALMRRAVDGTFSDLVRCERMRRQGIALRYVTSTQLSWQLLSNRTARIRQLKQLDDKMVAMTRYSATAMLADEVVDSAKLQHDRVFRIQVNDVGVRLGMLENNIIDALFLPEPQATQARNLQARIMMDTSEKDRCLGVLVFREDVMNNSARHQMVEQLLRIYDQACDSINKHGLRHYSDLIAKCCNVKTSTVDSLSSAVSFRHATIPRQSDIDHAKEWLKKQ